MDRFACGAQFLAADAGALWADRFADKAAIGTEDIDLADIRLVHQHADVLAFEATKRRGFEPRAIELDALLGDGADAVTPWGRREQHVQRPLIGDPRHRLDP